MKRRYSYVLLFGVPALLAAMIISILLFGAVAGLLWIFVFGDNPWPSATGNVLMVMFALTCVTLWIALMSAAYVIGKKQEVHASLNTRHVMTSVGITVLLIVFAVLHQWSVGNIGTKSETVLCAKFCQGKGYAGSSTPPRDTGATTCSCFDAQGREAIIIPMADIVAKQLE